MPRAKMTDRAEARRRYRAYLMAQSDTEGGETNEVDTAPDQTSRTSRGRNPQGQASGPALAPGTRVGFFTAMKMAYRTPHYREDLRGIGDLVLHTTAVWPVALVCAIAAALSYSQLAGRAYDANNPILSITLQFVLSPLPLLPPMVAGFLAPRATWLAGILAAAIAIFFLTLVYVVARPIIPGFGQIQSSDVLPNTFSWLTQALPFGALFGALSGWYKRFLGLTSMGNPRRATAGGSKQTSRPRR